MSIRKNGRILAGSAGINYGNYYTKEESNERFNSRVTNCLTEIPQDVKLDLSDDYKLTLYKGSKLYFPNGFTGRPVEPEKVEVLQGYNWIDCSASTLYDGEQNIYKIVLLSSEGYISISDDGGDTFSTPELITELASMDAQKNFFGVMNNGTTSSLWLILDKNGKISKSTDEGQTWTTPTEVTNLSNASHSWVQISGSNATNIFALSSDGYVARSSDGLTWSVTGQISNDPIYGRWTTLYFWNVGGTRYIACSNKGYLVESSDCITWGTPVLNEKLSSIEGNWIDWRTCASASVSESLGTNIQICVVLLSDTGYVSTSYDLIEWTTPRLIAKTNNRRMVWQPMCANLYISQENFITVSNNGYILRSNTIPNFDEYITKHDKTWTMISSSGPEHVEKMCVFVNNDELFEHSYRNEKRYWYTQDTNPAPTTEGAAFWYDTMNNRIKFTYDNGTHWSSYNMSLPIADLLNAYGKIFGIEQIYNGFGFIGSIMYALPGTKGLIPSGRNDDGTLNNIEWKLERVTVRDLMSENVQRETPFDYVLAFNGLEKVIHTNESQETNIYSKFHGFGVMEECHYRYDDELNINLQRTWSTNQIEIYDRLIPWYFTVIGKVRCWDGIIQNFETENAFRSVDYSEFKDLSDDVSLLKVSNCVTSAPQRIKIKLEAGVLTLLRTSQVFCPNGFNIYPLGTTWTVSSANANLGNHNWEAVATNGTTFVAAGRQGYLSTSSDGITWSNAVQNANLYNVSLNILKMKYGNGKFVALYDQGYIATSTDGSTWTNPIQKLNAGTTNNEKWDALCFGNGKFVAIRRDGYVSTSTDGNTWTTETLVSNLELNDDDRWNCANYFNNKYVVVSWKGYISTSEDGENWTEARPSLLDTSQLGLSAYAWNEICVADGKLFAIDGQGYKSYTEDLESWTVPMRSNTSYDQTTTSSWQVIEYNGTQLFAISEYGYTNSSTEKKIPRYDIRNITADMVYNTVNGVPTGSGLLYYKASSNEMFCKSLNNFVVSDTTPTGTLTDMVWWDLSTNKIKWYDSNTSSWDNSLRSLPIAYTDSQSGLFKSIQAFNTFGFMDTRVFALPGLKGLSPDGLNSDGSARTVELELQNVSYSGAFTINSTKNVFLHAIDGTTVIGINRLYEHNYQPIDNPDNYDLWFNPKTNKYRRYYTSEGGWVDIDNPCINVGRVSYNPTIGKIEGYNPKSTVRVYDANNILDSIVSYSIPSSNNANRWIRKYSSGWVEQGGYLSGGFGVHTINLSVPMRDTTYLVLATLRNNTISGSGGAWTNAYVQNTYQILIVNDYNNTWQGSGTYWYVCGMGA